MGQKDSITWGTIEIPYRYSHSRRKTLGISVHPDLSVTVRAPNGTSIETIKAFVHRRGGWISKAWTDFEQYLPKQPERRYISGESHRYLGRQFRLKIEQGEIDTVKCLRGYLWVTVKEEPTPERAKVMLEDWYRQHAKYIFKERLTVCHQRVLREGIPLPAMLIKKMVSRWGSYSSAGRITLNLALIKAPKECIDYVITHELCHHKVRHHGPKFWKLLHRLMPDFEERRKKLKLYAD
ncbi:M48 family metallopeptidase [Pelotalea chapellei]|uniref:M48 family metallopeptidase n=1 Tax=Pelotalea chapellei TaxID=44671 RepID=A0ABS5UCX0_9BACT|nr:SprT family zinc-dependent metalloprotease [Pelotalea chapellei]MBT1073480.1 M48 family metallopeptidase [Pelotalea chapellei]